MITLRITPEGRAVLAYALGHCHFDPAFQRDVTDVLHKKVLADPDSERDFDRHDVDDAVNDLNERLIEALDAWLSSDITHDDAARLAGVEDEPAGMAVGTLRDQVAGRVDTMCERLRLDSYRSAGVEVQPAPRKVG